MKQRYMKLVRRAYRYLRHPRIRKIKWLNAITLKLFERDLWNPTTRSIAVGLSIGLFCAMLPMPFQMVLAGACCLIGRGNIPLALAACWVSNPITQAPLMIAQESLGSWTRDLFHIPLPDFLAGTWDFELFGLDMSLGLGNFILGVGISATTLGILAYPLVYGIALFAPKPAPKPDKESRPSSP